MEEQPPHQMGKYTIRGQPDDGAFAHARLAIDNHGDEDLDHPQLPKVASESVNNSTEQPSISESEEDVQDLSLPSQTPSDLFYGFFKLMFRQNERN